MIQKLKTKLALLSTLFLLSPIALPASVLAADPAVTPDVTNSLCHGGAQLEISEKPGDCSKVGQQSTSKLNKLIATVLNLFSAIVGVIAVIMIIVGGFRYITSGGSSEAVGKAKSTILYAIIGLIIVAIAQVIVRFVLHQTTSATS